MGACSVWSSPTPPQASTVFKAIYNAFHCPLVFDTSDDTSPAIQEDCQRHLPCCVWRSSTWQRAQQPHRRTPSCTLAAQLPDTTGFFDATGPQAPAVRKHTAYSLPLGCSGNNDNVVLPAPCCLLCMTGEYYEHHLPCGTPSKDSCNIAPNSPLRGRRIAWPKDTTCTAQVRAHHSTAQV